MAALTDDVKRFIVQGLACYDTPLQVVEAVKEEFGIVVSRQQCEGYDPTKYAGRALSEKWRVVFEANRKAFKEKVDEIPIANRAFRLRALARMATKAEQMRNMALALQILEQAAKEVGDSYVNRRLDPPKPPGQDDVPTKPEYVLSPDEDMPDAPIL